MVTRYGPKYVYCKSLGHQANLSHNFLGVQYMSISYRGKDWNGFIKWKGSKYIKIIKDLLIILNLLSSRPLRILLGAWRSTRLGRESRQRMDRMDPVRHAAAPSDITGHERKEWYHTSLYISGIIWYHMSGCLNHLKSYVYRFFQQTPVAGLFRPILSGDLGKSPSRHEAQAWSVSDPVDDRAKSKALVPYLHNIWPLLAIWDPNQRGYWEPCRTPSFLKRGWQIPCLSQTNAVLFSDGYCSWNQRNIKKPLPWLLQIIRACIG